MLPSAIADRFAAIGARCIIRPRRPMEFVRNFSADVRRDRKGEYFDLVVRENVPIEVIDAQPRLRHLVLLVRNQLAKEKYLCGHDERHWFVSAVPGSSVRDVKTAVQALRPPEVGTRFVRQGEWFFVPANVTVDERMIHRNEPISRGNGSKPHICQELFRLGGETVMVCRKYPAGITAEEMQTIVNSDPSAMRWGWTRMTRNAEVYVRGTIRHADHKTRQLEGWHRVYLNGERFSPWAASVVFLD